MDRKQRSLRVHDDIWNPFTQACDEAGHSNKSLGIERVLRYMLLNRDTLVHILAYDDTI